LERDRDRDRTVEREQVIDDERDRQIELEQERAHRLTAVEDPDTVVTNRPTNGTTTSGATATEQRAPKVRRRR